MEDNARELMPSADISAGTDGPATEPQTSSTPSDNYAESKINDNASLDAKDKLIPETDLNRMKSTFQRREAQMQREMQAMRQQAQQLQDYMWRLQQAQLPPEQQPLADYERRVALEAQRVQEAQYYQAQQAQALEPVFKEIVIRDFLDEYRNVGVSRQMLERFQSPDDMEAFCKLQRDMSRDRNAKARGGRDQVAGSTGAASNPKDWGKKTASELIREFF